LIVADEISGIGNGYAGKELGREPRLRVGGSIGCKRHGGKRKDCCATPKISMCMSTRDCQEIEI
jgi:hypothetical protein